VSVSSKDPVAVRIVDGHGQVAVVRLTREGSPYVRNHGAVHWLDQVPPSRDLSLYCSRARDVAPPVSVAALLRAVADYKAGAAPAKLALHVGDTFA
jgi:hypothetical protein